MSDDSPSEIEKILSDLPTDDSKQVTESIDENRKQVMIKALQQAAKELGKSPTIREFRDLETSRSATVIKQAFGTWNRAKKAAGLETRQRGTVRKINEKFFADINTAEKAYWFGTLIATSSLSAQRIGSNYALRLGRVEDKKYFLTELLEAVESDYPISKQSGNKSDKIQYQLQISNPVFIDNLLEAGYPERDEELSSFPEIEKELVPPFLRGYLESSGYFTSGWNIKVNTDQQASSLKEWFKDFGAKRPSVSETTTRGFVVRVSNVFDVKTIFEQLWPNGIETEPSYMPYPKKIIEYLEEEYPYPENVEYLEG